MIDFFNNGIGTIRTSFDWLLGLIAFITAAFYAKRLFDKDLAKEAVTMAIGVIFVAIGISMNKFFWGTQRVVFEANQELGLYIKDEWSFLTIVPIMIGILGYGAHLSYGMRSLFGKWWLINFVVITTLCVYVINEILYFFTV
jgi:hypothetical protein